MTQFATRKGPHMLCPPEPLDRWIGRDIRQTQEGDYLDCSMGELLGQQESKEYEQYQQRLLKRCKLGGKQTGLCGLLIATCLASPLRTECTLCASERKCTTCCSRPEREAPLSTLKVGP